jgi:hypothetical protein
MVTVDLIGIIGSLILTFGTPVLIFFMYKKRIKKLGTVNIHDSYAEFKLAESMDKIEYEDIKTYQVERYNGTHLKIEFKNGKNFKLQANSNFCNSDQFDNLCQEFENTVQNYKTTNNVELTRKKSMFEQAWMLPFLIILTGGLIAGIIFALSEGKSIPPSFYASAAVVIPFWISYLNARNKAKIKETK